ncbi:UNVERIFIED_CONTAM: hypothetical protein PYX00_007257 [Menopon gallinae]|uniref:Translation initiation factor eIF2B subunit beta n=1 Tax=Menopon gallinae TaxID=328185 RepID=A0AAW2HJ61_9NEOP
MNLKEFDRHVYAFVNDISRRKIVRSHDVAVKTVKFLKSVIVEANYHKADELISLVSGIGKKLVQLLPHQPTVENMVHRILKIIRDEYVAGQKDKLEEVDPQESLHKIVTMGGDHEDYMKTVPDLVGSVIDHVAEFEAELDISTENIAAQASEHIHSNEIIMTLGKSTAVEVFLKSAAKTRKFEVIVAECAPYCKGHELAVSLGNSKIQTTLISDAAIFAIMSRVNKVIIGTHTVMANGGLRAISGSHIMALAAKHYSVPVFVLAPMYKLSRHYICSYDQHAFNIYESPEGVLNYSDGDLAAKVRAYNPVFDYVPPELVTLFISNVGGHSPSYIYRLISELYHPDDNEL